MSTGSVDRSRSAAEDSKQISGLLTLQNLPVHARATFTVRNLSTASGTPPPTASTNPDCSVLAEEDEDQIPCLDGQYDEKPVSERRHSRRLSQSQLPGGSAGRNSTLALRLEEEATAERELRDKVVRQIQAQSLARSSPSEEGPYKCTKCKRLYRTKQSWETHSKTCNFEVSTSEEEEEEEEEMEEDEPEEVVTKTVRSYPLRNRRLSDVSPSHNITVYSKADIGNPHVVLHKLKSSSVQTKNVDIQKSSPTTEQPNPTRSNKLLQDATNLCSTVSKITKETLPRQPKVLLTKCSVSSEGVNEVAMETQDNDNRLSAAEIPETNPPQANHSVTVEPQEKTDSSSELEKQPPTELASIGETSRLSAVNHEASISESSTNIDSRAKPMQTSPELKVKTSDMTKQIPHPQPEKVFLDLRSAVATPVTKTTTPEPQISSAVPITSQSVSLGLPVTAVPAKQPLSISTKAHVAAESLSQIPSVSTVPATQPLSANTKAHVATVTTTTAPIHSSTVYVGRGGDGLKACKISLTQSQRNQNTGRNVKIVSVSPMNIDLLKTQRAEQAKQEKTKTSLPNLLPKLSSPSPVKAVTSVTISTSPPSKVNPPVATLLAPSKPIFGSRSDSAHGPVAQAVVQPIIQQPSPTVLTPGGERLDGQQSITTQQLEELIAAGRVTCLGSLGVINNSAPDPQALQTLLPSSALGAATAYPTTVLHCHSTTPLQGLVQQQTAPIAGVITGGSPGSPVTPIHQLTPQGSPPGYTPTPTVLTPAPPLLSPGSHLLSPAAPLLSPGTPVMIPGGGVLQQMSPPHPGLSPQAGLLQQAAGNQYVQQFVPASTPTPQLPSYPTHPTPSPQLQSYPSRPTPSPQLVLPKHSNPGMSWAVTRPGISLATQSTIPASQTPVAMATSSITTMAVSSAVMAACSVVMTCRMSPHPASTCSVTVSASDRTATPTLQTARSSPVSSVSSEHADHCYVAPYPPSRPQHRSVTSSDSSRHFATHPGTGRGKIRASILQSLIHKPQHHRGKFTSLNQHSNQSGSSKPRYAMYYHAGVPQKVQIKNLGRPPAGHPVAGSHKNVVMGHPSSAVPSARYSQGMLGSPSKAIAGRHNVTAHLVKKHGFPHSSVTKRNLESLRTVTSSPSKMKLKKFRLSEHGPFMGDRKPDPAGDKSELTSHQPPVKPADFPPFALKSERNPTMHTASTSSHMDPVARKLSNIRRLHMTEKLAGQGKIRTAQPPMPRPVQRLPKLKPQSVGE